MESIQYPEICEPIVQAIRAEVPRPVVLPTDDKHSLRFFPCGCDPMGMLSDAMFTLPSSAIDFQIRDWTDEMITAFGLWWDELDVTDPGISRRCSVGL
jgi:hypothetical protein